MPPPAQDNPVQELGSSFQTRAYETECKYLLARLTPRVWLGSMAALWTLLLLGIAWRFVGLNWDSGYHLHPDERFLTMKVPELRWPSSWAEWFDTSRAPHNPFNLPDMGLFVYGQLPLFGAKLVAGRLSCGPPEMEGSCDSYEGILLVGRFLSALFDSGTVLFTLLIARRLLGAVWGLVAGVFVAFTALHIQHAHFYVTDPFATFFLVAAFWAALKWRDSLKARWALLSGAMWGLALACKISSALFAPALGVLVLLPLLQKQPASADGTRGARPWMQVLAGAFVLALAAFWCFRVAHPMGFRGEAWGGILDVRLPIGRDEFKADTFWESLDEQRAITTGERDVPWNLQWFGRRDFVWPARNLLVWGVGWQLMLPAVAAIFLLAWRFRPQARRSPSRREDAAWIAIVLWTLGCFAYHAGQFSKFSRYFLLMTPFVALLGAWAVREAWRISTSLLSSPKRALQVLAWALRAGAAAPIAGTVLWGSAVASIYPREHTRVLASRFLEAQPPGTRIANESAWDDALPLGDKSPFEMLDLRLLDVDNAQKRAHVLDTLETANWLVVSSPRMWTSIPRLSVRHPFTTRYYHALFSGELGWRPEKQWASYPQLNIFGLRWEFPDDDTEEALSVYDHPRVVLFRKTPDWSREKAEQLLPIELTQARDEAPIAELRARGVTVDESALPWLPRLQSSP
jgi:hypothetical protein